MKATSAGPVEGELVRFPGMTCDCPDCGCDRAMAGMASSRATTTFKVVDRTDLDAASFRQLLHDALERDGWFDLDCGDDESWVTDFADHHLESALAFEAGSVLELRDATLWRRG